MHPSYYGGCCTIVWACACDRYEALLAYRDPQSPGRPRICGPTAAKPKASGSTAPSKELALWYGVAPVSKYMNGHAYVSHFRRPRDADEDDDPREERAPSTPPSSLGLPTSSPRHHGNCSVLVDGTPTRFASWHAPKELAHFASQLGASIASQLRLVAVLREPIACVPRDSTPPPPSWPLPACASVRTTSVRFPCGCVCGCVCATRRRHLSWYNHRLLKHDVRGSSFWHLARERCAAAFRGLPEGFAPSHAALAACEVQRLVESGCSVASGHDGGATSTAAAAPTAGTRTRGTATPAARDGGSVASSDASRACWVTLARSALDFSWVVEGLYLPQLEMCSRLQGSHAVHARTHAHTHHCSHTRAPLFSPYGSMCARMTWHL